MTYENEYNEWLRTPDEFWRQQASKLAWYNQPTVGHESVDGQSQWFADGTMNTCYLALDHHVLNGRAKQAALIYDSPVSGVSLTYSYESLLDLTARAAGMLIDLGVSKGDTVIIYMPMIPEAAIAMLACARIGAIHSVVFGGFAAPELASRIADAKPSVILTASCGIEVERIIPYAPLINEALRLCEHEVSACVVLQREAASAPLHEGRDFDWKTLLERSGPVDCVPANACDPLYILYTSGTTGRPKGIVRDNGGHATALNYSMGSVFDMNAGDVFWAASDVGWVVGHSYIVYGPLIRGCTTILFEGKPIMTPDAGAFWRVIEAYNVNTLFSAPTAFRAIRREDPNGVLIKKYNTESLRRVFAAGERLDPPTQVWMGEKLGVGVIDNWWQTETGWPICANLTGVEDLPVKYGSATKPVPGFDVRVLDESGQRCEAGEQGKVVIKLPLPPGCLMTVWGDHLRFQDAYLSQFPGYYSSGDGGYVDHEGYVFIMGRVDDVINVAGHRLSTGDLEEVVAQHSSVSECAVVAMRHELKGEVPVGFVVLSAHDNPENVVSELVDLVRSEVGGIACYKQTHIVNSLPKTRSGKILRKTLKSMLNHEAYSVPPTIDDPSVITELEHQLKGEEYEVSR